MRLALPAVLLLSGLLLPGCQLMADGSAQPGATDTREAQPIAVETAIAATGTANPSLQLTGTTAPIQTVALRSRVEGQLLSLAVTTGDRVQAGEAIGQLDVRLLQTAVNEAEAELAVRQAEVAQAQAGVAAAQTQVAQAQAELNQAQADANRLQFLAQQGAISAQAAEVAQTSLATNQQAVQSAAAQVRSQEQAVSAAAGRVESQRAIIAQAQERLSYATLTAPLSGVVLEPGVDPGNLVTAGGEVLQIGDFSAVKVVVDVSELNLADIRVGQPVTVTFDAFPGDSFSGQVRRISPVADRTARLIPVDIEVANPNGRLGSGLLARVDFAAPRAQQVVVPLSALELSSAEAPTLFVVTPPGEAATDAPAQVQARVVEVGDRADDQVEILSGLAAGEAYVVRSSEPLEDGQTVRLSLLSSAVISRYRAPAPIPLS